MNLKKKTVFIISLLLIPLAVVAYPFEKRTMANGYSYVYHKHNEASYQEAWCKAHNGVAEYENKDKTRVDCLTDTHAVEFDFANKWAESIGQALHYGIMTGKKPMVVLILENEKQMKYYTRVKKVGDKYDITVEYITNDILELNEDGKCINPECKCNKNIHQKQIQPNIYTIV